MAFNNYYPLRNILLIILCYIHFSFILSQYLLEDSSIYVDINKYPNYYISNDNRLKKCDYPCYECSSSSSDNNNQNCLSCERGYEFDSTSNSCIKCPKNAYKYIYTSYNTCINSNEEFCKKVYTKCTLLTDELFKECPLDIPFLIKAKKMCVDKKVCNDNELNEACEISNLNYIKSREINPTFFLNDNNLVNKHLLNLLQDKYGNILFEACGLFDEYRYYYGIKKEDGNSNFTDNDNNPTYKVLYTDSYSGIYINKTDYALLDFDINNGGHYIISFYPSNYTFEIESFGRGGMNLYVIKIKNLKDMFTKTADKKMIRNCTITSKINTFLNYNSDRYSNPYNYYLVSYVGVNYLNEYSLYILIIQIQDIEFTTKNFFLNQ